MPRTVAILGATGSIGRSTLEVIRASHGRLTVAGMTAHQRLDELVQQAQKFLPSWIVATDSPTGARYDWSDCPSEIERHLGSEAIAGLVAAADVDVVVSAIVGSAGLQGTWAAIEAGKTVALANKESLVVAGSLIMDRARQTQATLLPIDSEHSAIFQCLQAGRRSEVRRIILTASGGPFREYSAQQLRLVTVEQALAHPTWDMGPKITIDSATMMNKALEIIEARWLFDIDPDQIEVVVHPQSTVHSLVEFRDGSSIAQLSPPDMKLPIQYALTYPDRAAGPAQPLDLTAPLRMDFYPADGERFPAIALGHEVARQGGSAGAVLSAANEAAVELFLDGQLAFTEIVPACRSALEHHTFDPSPSLDDLLALDRWARKEVTRWICT